MTTPELTGAEQAAEPPARSSRDTSVEGCHHAEQGYLEPCLRRRCRGGAGGRRGHPPPLSRPRRDGRGGPAGRSDAEHLWVVDPLDGTANFAHKIPHFAVSIAYYREGQPEVGVVYNPVQDEWITAVRGQGAFREGERIQVADHTQLNESLVGVGFYYDRDVMMEATLAAIPI